MLYKPLTPCFTNLTFKPVEIVRNGTMHVGRRQVKTVRTDVNIVHTVCVRILQQYILTPTRTVLCTSWC